MAEKASRSAVPVSITDDGLLMFAFAHDLRTNLRTVLTRLQLLQRGSSETAESQLLQEAADAATEIDCLLNAMVAYCGVRADPAVMSLGLLLRGLLIERKSALEAVQAEVAIPNRLELDQVDMPVPVALTGVLKELLTNSCKFRKKTDPLRISIQTQMKGDALEIIVSDNGLGVASDDLEKIFVPFHRLHSRAEFPGHGLGLATCRRIVTAWGGHLTAEENHEGLTLRITVPAP